MYCLGDIVCYPIACVPSSINSDILLLLTIWTKAKKILFMCKSVPVKKKGCSIRVSCDSRLKSKVFVTNTSCTQVCHRGSDNIKAKPITILLQEKISTKTSIILTYMHFTNLM